MAFRVVSKELGRIEVRQVAGNLICFSLVPLVVLEVVRAFSYGRLTDNKRPKTDNKRNTRTQALKYINKRLQTYTKRLQTDNTRLNRRETSVYIITSVQNRKQLTSVSAHIPSVSQHITSVAQQMIHAFFLCCALCSTLASGSSSRRACV